jgi:hypothetical protein
MCNQTALFFHQITQRTSRTTHSHKSQNKERLAAPTAVSHGCTPPLPAFATTGENAVCHRLPLPHSAQRHCFDVSAPRTALPTVTAITNTHAQRKKPRLCTTSAQVIHLSLERIDRWLIIHANVHVECVMNISRMTMLYTWGVGIPTGSILNSFLSLMLPEQFSGLRFKT